MARRRRRPNNRNKAYRRMRMLQQKLYALILLFVGIVSVPICDNDGTFAVFMVPIAIYLFFTREDWLV